MHSETLLADAEQGLRDFQIWLNMPSNNKMREPQYQNITEQPVLSFTNQQGVSLERWLKHCKLVGEPFNQPIAQIDPFVMITDAEIC
jgi:redox-sensitive bicupin YhaK (pirin superfamily)